jgi:hypothetical protein
MTLLATIGRWEVASFLGLLTLAVFVAGVTGRMRLAGILMNKSTGAFDPGRLQLLVLTGFFAILMLTGIPQMTREGKLSLPSDALLYALGGSQGVYLVRKFVQVTTRPKGD